MKRTATLTLSVMLCCISCGRDSDALRIEVEKHASEIANQVKEQAQALPNAEQIKAEIERLIAAVEEKDLCNGLRGVRPVFVFFLADWGLDSVPDPISQMLNLFS